MHRPDLPQAIHPSRRAFCSALAALVASSQLAAPHLAGATDWRDEVRAALARGVDFLWKQQQDNGGFPSQTYGLFRKGQSLTPFVLGALVEVPPDVVAPRPKPAGKALSYMLSLSREHGALGFADAAADYPVYSTALALRVAARLQPPGWKEAFGPMETWLRKQQLLAKEGWAGSTAQGGFPMGEPSPRKPPDAGHVDLSMTRRAIEALVALKTPLDDPALVQARAFVLRCQAPGGGFIYSPVEPALNKGVRADGPNHPSEGYGTATADGLLALTALGVATDDPAVADNVAYLHRIHRTDENPGVSDGPMAPFATAMRGYYRATSAQTFVHTGGPPDWAPTMATAVMAEQRPNGSWANESALQKEDDPLVATPFAIRALTAVLMA